MSGFARTIARRVLRLPLGLLPQDAVVRVVRGPVAGMRWVVGSGTHGCWLGSYERDVVTEFAHRAAKASLVLDIGAHVGYYTLAAARRIRPGGRVLAFEPNARNLELLRYHCALNGLDNVQVIDAAVGDTGGTASFASQGSSYEGRLAADGEVPVRVVTLDEMPEDLTPEDVMKIDVEGAELEVLHGGATMIERGRPTIFLATHGQAVHDACIGWLAQRGYRVAHLTSDQVLAIGA